MKEQHRRQMIEWSEKQRALDRGIFCREAVHLYKGMIFLNIFQLFLRALTSDLIVQLVRNPFG